MILVHLLNWEKVKKICDILEKFWIVTNLILESDYSTSNLFLRDIAKVSQVLNTHLNDGNDFIRRMVGKMKSKFDKYWGECYILLPFAAILNSRHKL